SIFTLRPPPCSSLFPYTTLFRSDGRVYTSWWWLGNDWSGIHDNWRNIGGFFHPGAPVAAVARKPEQLDLFITGNDSRVYTSWWSDRKSTRLNSSHVAISYAVFCL